MKFEIYEKYQAEQQSNAERSAELQEKVFELSRKYKELQTEFEYKMRESLTSGNDVTEELDRIDDLIQQTKRAMERAQREYQVYNATVKSVSITKEQIIADWNANFNPQYYENEIKPTLNDLEVAKKAYYEAMCSYFDKVYAIEDLREEVSSGLGYEFPFKFHVTKLITNKEYDHYFIRQDDMDRAQMRKEQR